MTDINTIHDQRPKQRKILILEQIIVCFISGLVFFLIGRSTRAPSEKLAMPIKRAVSPVNRGVCVFISDAASGVGRESALKLAATGVHVLAGEFF